LPRVMCFLLKDEDAYGRETQRAASTCFTILFVFSASLFVFRHIRNKIIHFPI
jgi:hypothetical protein